jgi:hypothetical protein
MAYSKERHDTQSQSGCSARPASVAASTLPLRLARVDRADQGLRVSHDDRPASFLGLDQDAQAYVQADEGGARPALVEDHRLTPPRLTRLVLLGDDVQVRGFLLALASE